MQVQEVTNSSLWFLALPCIFWRKSIPFRPCFPIFILYQGTCVPYLARQEPLLAVNLCKVQSSQRDHVCLFCLFLSMAMQPIRILRMERADFFGLSHRRWIALFTRLLSFSCCCSDDVTSALFLSMAFFPEQKPSSTSCKNVFGAKDCCREVRMDGKNSLRIV